ncbi:MAG: hypothetical protein IKG85_04940 [Clostridia bacterium]|nr:hypothetical protein [Clostridia bacterium]
MKRALFVFGLFAFGLLCAAPMLCGCLGPVSLEEYGYVISVGVDTMDEGYYFTFALQRELSEPGTESEGGAELLACRAASFDGAVKELESRSPVKLNFSRLNFFVLSRSAAEGGAVKELLSLSFDSLKIRSSAAVVVAECGASKFIGGLSSNNDPNVKKLQSAVMLDMERSGMVRILSVSRLMEAAAGGAFDYCAPLGEYDPEVITDMEQKSSESEGKDPLREAGIGAPVGGLKSRVEGTALFSGLRMTGELTREQTMYLNMVCGDFKNGTVTLPCGGESVTLMLRMKRVRRGIKPGEGVLRAYAEIELEAGVHTAPKGFPEEELDEWLAHEAPALLREKAEETFLICRGAGSDAMLFGVDAEKQMLFPCESFAGSWREAYRGLEAEFRFILVNTDKTSGGGAL